MSAKKFPIHATVNRTKSIDEIVAEAPAGMVPMFTVTSAYEDYLVNEHVVIRNHRVYECLSDEEVLKDDICGLHFVRYINEN